MNKLVYWALAFCLAFIVLSIFLSGGIYAVHIICILTTVFSAIIFINIRSGVYVFLAGIFAIVIVNSLITKGVIHYPYAENKTSFIKGLNFLLLLSFFISLVFIFFKGNRRVMLVARQQEKEITQNEIARDFHDELGNKLISLSRMTEFLRITKDESKRDEISFKIESTAKDIYNNFRDFIWTLDAKSAYANEVFMYLRDFAEDHLKFSEINLYVSSVPDQLPVILLPSRYGREIVPIFKEAIANVNKHANAKNLYLDFVISKKSLIIKLRDDGVGINKSKKMDGNGFKNMLHRAKAINGSLQVNQSMPGTEVLFTAPLP